MGLPNVIPQMPPSPNPLLQPAVLAQAAQAVHQAQTAPGNIPPPNAPQQVKPIGLPPVVAPQPQMQARPIKDTSMPPVMAPGHQTPAPIAAPDKPAMTVPPIKADAPAAAKTSNIPPLGLGITPSFGAPPSVSLPRTEFGDMPKIGEGMTPADVRPFNQAEMNQAELARRINTGSGINQIHSKIEGLLPNHPLLGKLLGYPLQALATIGDVGLRAVAPSVDLAIPGTSLHHQQDLAQQERIVNADTSRAKSAAETANLGATTEHTQAETPEVAPNAASLRGLQTTEGAKNNADAAKATAETAELPTLLASYAHAVLDAQKRGVDPANDPIVQQQAAAITGIQKQAAPKDGEKTPLLDDKGQPLMGVFHASKEGGYYTDEYGNLIKNPKPIPPPAAVGAVTFVAPDPNNPGGGKLIKVNPGQNVPAGSVNAAGLSGENVKTNEGLQGGRADIAYAKTYLDGGKYSGAGDEAVMEKFFDLAKPSSGFRMSQPQIDMLLHGRSWMDSAAGVAYHAKTGVWFPPEQRKQIVSTMESLETARENAAPYKTGSAPPTSTAQPGMIRARDPQGVLHEAPKGTALPQGWKAE
jgi:hypothetical protein